MSMLIGLLGGSSLACCSGRYDTTALYLDEPSVLAMFDERYIHEQKELYISCSRHYVFHQLYV